MNLREMVAESNRIEGILRPATEDEVKAHEEFFRCREPDISELEAFVKVVQPGARLRNEYGLNVRVGNHYPPPGGPAILYGLKSLMLQATAGQITPYRAHIEYEQLHPFTDGNGRSGRVLWYWMMKNSGDERWRLGFLHAFYYQTLNACSQLSEEANP